VTKATGRLAGIAEALYGGAQPGHRTLHLGLGACTLCIRSNSDRLIEGLSRYFASVTNPTAAADIEIVAIEREPPELHLDFLDWKREPGKSGRKDSYFDLPDGRLVRKVRTGMVFLQSETLRIAAGPCLQNDNQVINFINAQYMNWLQNRGWLICHAAGLVRGGRALGIAGFSGGGKSTLMLHMMEDPGTHYLTNDRLFLRSDGDAIQAAGIPKLPRVNPGTIVHNPRLHPLIQAAEREALLAMPNQQLWQLEDKYDVLIDQVYGPGRITMQAPLGAFLVLNWRRDDNQPLQLQLVDLYERRELLGAIMKSPGPFYQFADGSFFTDDTPQEAQPYLETLSGIDVYEASGRVDFDALIQQLAKTTA
jgi:HprK-related kinase B